MRRILALSATALVAACGGGDYEPPAPANPGDSRSVADAARACDRGALEADAPFTAEPDFRGEPGQAEMNALRSDLFIEHMATQPCVYELPSGLLVRVNAAAGADAASPESGDLVTVHYAGTFPDGSTFDSSYDRGEPATFPSDRLIAGWVEALPLMRVGEEWELFIPADLAYRARGTPGGPIGPNQALVFRLELLDLPDRPE